VDAWLGEMKVWRKEMQAAQERTGANLMEMKAEIRSLTRILRPFEVTLLSQMDIHQEG
jgi:hypothetical protein